MRLSDWTLERYALGELPADRARAVAEILAADPAEAARLDALRASNAEILAAYPPAQVAARLRGRVDPVPANSSGWKFAIPALALAAVALIAARFVILPADVPVIPPNPDEVPEVIRTKGDPHLDIHRLDGHEVHRLSDGAGAKAGDLIQISVQPASRPYSAVLSIDGRGNVTVHAPPGRARAGALRQSFELDDAPGFERFFLILSDEPLSDVRVREAAEALAHGPGHGRTGNLPLPTEQISVLLEKP